MSNSEQTLRWFSQPAWVFAGVAALGLLMYIGLDWFGRTGFAEIVPGTPDSVIVPMIHNQTIEVNDLQLVVKNNFFTFDNVGSEKIKVVTNVCHDGKGYDLPTLQNATGVSELYGHVLLFEMDAERQFCVMVGHPRLVQGFEVSILSTGVEVPIRMDNENVIAPGYRIRFTSTDSSTSIAWKPFNAFSVLVSTTLFAIGITGIIDSGLRRLAVVAPSSESEQGLRKPPGSSPSEEEPPPPSSMIPNDRVDSPSSGAGY